MMEVTLANAFTNAVVVAIADLMDDGSSHGRKADQKQNQAAKVPQIEQPTRIKSISKSPSSYCSPYDTLYWLGGDCLRESAATSLATITECATMKTDNTTEMPVVSSTQDVAAIVSPCESRPQSDSRSNIDSNRDDELIHMIEEQKVDSIESTADIISQYHQRYPSKVDTIDENSNSRSLFTGSLNEIDYTDPMNSIVVEDHTEGSNKSRNLNGSGIKNNHAENKLRSGFFPKTPQKRNDSIFCINPDSTSPWCGGVPSILTYNGDGCDPIPEQQDEQYPDYYAEFKPQRQFAFDEDDGDGSSESTLTPPALVDADSNGRYTSSSADEATMANDGNSVMTGASSIQSFMVINHPHTYSTTIPSTPLVDKLQKHSSSRKIHSDHGQNHLHKLISSPGPTVISPGSSHSRGTNGIDSDNDSLDYALTQPLMRKLQKHLPYGKRGDSFWLQYSLIRDGASLDSLLDMVHRDSNNTSNHICSVLAIETVEGEVFGAFLTQTWRRSNRQWYGGGQSFLWTASSATTSAATSNEDEGSSSNECQSKVTGLRVFPYSFENSYVQLCDRDRLLVGGGDGGENFERHCYGFGLALESDLLKGSSCPCTTFESPSLSRLHSDGSTFEVRNLEVWTLTPCLSIVDNPSQGLVRVRNKKDKKKRKSKKDKIKAVMKSQVLNDEENEHSFKDYYNCSHPNCHSIDVDDFQVGEEGYGSIRGEQTILRNRNVRRHNSQRRKNRNKYVGQFASM